MSKLSIVILAAGKGTRMYSDTPKVLHTIAGKSMLQHVIDSVTHLAAENIYVVYGHNKAQLEAALINQPVKLVLQAEQLGTGHAALQAMPHISDDENVLLLYADTPLIHSETLQMLINNKPQNGISLLTVKLDDPTGYGRILRNNGEIVGIVEQKDATETQLAINEINTGIMFVDGKNLKKWLANLKNNNSQNEFYLTDIIAMAHQDGSQILATHPQAAYEVQGVNNRLQLSNLERIYQQKQAEKLLLAGVSLLDPARFDLRGSFTHGKDVIIDSNVIIEGNVTLGDRVKIGAGVILKNCTIGDDCEISPYSVVEDSRLDKFCTIGPFARLRPGSVLKEKAHVGNFVEMKKAELGIGSKAGHLSYLGDAEIGDNVNIGAGTITCNYDGVNKHTTIIQDNVFIGSDTQLIAPVTIGKGATIAAGTTITQDVGDDKLVLSRIPAVQVSGWKRPVKK